jgi:CRISPR-associated endonuclease/helicase Cas3
MLAYCIAGHHAGLPDGASDDETKQQSTLRWRLDHHLHDIPAVACPELLLTAPAIALKQAGKDLLGFQLSLFIRMIFACLVDADRLATERFCDPLQAAKRETLRPAIRELHCALTDSLSQKQATVTPTPVNRVRADVLSRCVASANLPPGFFSLQVPTGGGKTYSSLAFALGHASRHEMRRVVYAIPFTSIIDQTTDAFRMACGKVAKGANCTVLHADDENREHRRQQYQ